MQGMQPSGLPGDQFQTQDLPGEGLQLQSQVGICHVGLSEGAEDKHHNPVQHGLLFLTTPPSKQDGGMNLEASTALLFLFSNR